MNRHWKAIQWFSVATLVLFVATLVAGEYVMAFALLLAALFVAFIMSVAWLRDRQRRDRHHSSSTGG